MEGGGKISLPRERDLFLFILPFSCQCSTLRALSLSLCVFLSLLILLTQYYIFTLLAPSNPLECTWYTCMRAVARPVCLTHPVPTFREVSMAVLQGKLYMFVRVRGLVGVRVDKSGGTLPWRKRLVGGLGPGRGGKNTNISELRSHYIALSFFRMAVEKCA